MKEELCPACGRKLPAEGSIRKDVKTGRIVHLHFECAGADRSLPKRRRRYTADLFS